MSHPTGTFGGVISLVGFLGIFLVQVPVFAVLIVGLILLSGPGRRLPPRSLLLARAGLGVMLAEVLASMTWSALLPQILSRMDYRDGFIRTYGIINGIVGFILAILFAAGVGLLVAALLGAREPSAGGPPPNPAPSGPAPSGPAPSGPAPSGPAPSVPPGQ